ncbi:MAG: redoxin domain-containing protein [Bacteroidales bacterium]|nr:redoxin domain-containing protein [Bacteroidales bacterium]
MKFVTALFFLLFAALSTACSDTGYILTVKISRLPDSKVFLATMRGDAYKIIDTAELKDGLCKFNLSVMNQPGMYKIIPEISFSQGYRNAPLNDLDIIINREDVVVRTVYPWLRDSLVIMESEENNVYFDYLKQEMLIQNKLGLLHNLLLQFPADDEFYSTVVKRYNALQKEKRILIQHTCASHPGTFATGLIAMQRSPIPDAGLPEPTRQAYIKQHYFDELDFTDENLINSNAYTRSLIQYLMLYRDPALSRDELEKEFMKAVDIILSHVNKNPVVYDFLLNYLMEGFERLKLENVLKYVADNYLNTVCTTDNSATLKRRLEGYSKLAVGETAPDIIIPDQQNQEIKLSAIHHAYTLVVFWSSSCPSCEELLPKIKKWYSSKTIDLEILAVSIDTLASDWIKAVESGGYNWLNGCDLKEWDGQAAQDYFLYATPSMFLLDRNRKILAKPLSFEDFLRAVEGLGK